MSLPQPISQDARTNKGRPLRVLFIPWRDQRDASARSRVYVYVEYLPICGIQPHVILPPALVAKNKIARLWSWLRLLWSAWRADAVWIERVLFTPRAFRLLRTLNPRIVFDLDDALFANVTGLSYPTDSPEWQKWMAGFRAQLAEALRHSKIVTTSTEHVANYAHDYNPNITRLPDAIDLKYFPRRTRAHDSSTIIIGWNGRPENRVYVRHLAPVFAALAREFGDRIALKILCEEPIQMDGIRVIYQPWSLETEVQDLASFDIAIRPLIEDEWSRGKGNFSAVQYMALGLPVVLSPIGANPYVVRDGVDGFLASSLEEWVDKLGQLVRDAELRQRIGLAGRKSVEEKFSVQANLPIVAAVIRRVAQRPSSVLAPYAAHKP